MRAVPSPLALLPAAALLGATLCLAQSRSAPASDQIAAVARLSVAVARARDSIQKQLALPRNDTPQAQRQLRADLVAQVAAIMRRAGMSDSVYRREMFIVSTDTAARAIFDRTVASLTGAPLPGQAPAPVVMKVPAGPVGAHIAHVVNAFAETPKGEGLLPTAMAEAAIAATHAALAAREPENLEAMKMHAGHVINAIDPSVVAKGPGLGYGVKRAALGVATHIDLAARANGASPDVVMHANHVGTAARNTVRRADAIVALATRIRSATTAADAASLVSQLVSLVDELTAGKDLDADGHVTWKEGEGGLQQCEEHVKLMLDSQTGLRPGGA